MTLDQLIAQTKRDRAEAERARSHADSAIRALVTRAKAEDREELTPEEDQKIRRYDAAKRRAATACDELRGKLAALEEAYRDELRIDEKLNERHPVKPGIPVVAEAESPWVRSTDRRPAAVARGQRFADHPVVADYAAARARSETHITEVHSGLGALTRALSTGGTGSALVPTVWTGDVIDRARNLAAVTRAGAELVPMDARTVEIGRLTADPTAAFRTEGSPITPSDPTFDNVTLTAQTMSVLTVGSLEWFMDAPNADEVVQEAIAAAVAQRWDLVALFGGLETGAEVEADALNATFPTPPNPRGVLATLLAVAASSVLGGAVNGTTQTAASFWREVQQALFFPQSFNEAPTALLWPSKLAQLYTDAYDTTNQPLRMPENIAGMSKFVTNQIPAAMTPGTGTLMADLFTGDWRQLLMGQRLDLTVQVLTERYAENGQIGIVAHWRGDVALARPRAFSVYRYLKAAA